MQAQDSRSSNIVEFIFKEGDDIVNKIFDDALEAEELLGRFTANIRLDLHNVTDLLDKNQKIVSDDLRKENPIVVISFVGKYSETRSNARNDIKERIRTGQIDFGLLVFKRGKKRYSKTSIFYKEGSKAWANNYIKTTGSAVFIDDEGDHIRSVKGANIDNLTCILFPDKDDQKLLELLNTRVVEIISK